jgi:hypothetical protein
MASYIPTVIADDASRRTMGWSNVVSIFVLACVALALGEALVRRDFDAGVLGRALIWLMRGAAVVVLVWYFPTFFGAVRTIFLDGFVSPRGALDSITLVVIDLVAQPLLLLGGAEMLAHAGHHHLQNGQAR